MLQGQGMREAGMEGCCADYHLSPYFMHFYYFSSQDIRKVRAIVESGKETEAETLQRTCHYSQRCKQT